MKPDPKVIVRFVLGMAIAAAVISSAKQLTASFTAVDTTTHVEINGVDFGSFDEITGLEKLYHGDDEGYTTVGFKRDFVTDPSLYLWAKNSDAARNGLTDIHLVEKNERGEEVSRNTLRLCHPLSWSVESATSTLGGFHESVEIAVQR